MKNKYFTNRWQVRNRNMKRYELTKEQWERIKKLLPPEMETSLIYANATTEMKQAAVKKISSKENSVFRDDEKFKYGDNDDIIKQLYGLI